MKELREHVHVAPSQLQHLEDTQVKTDSSGINSLEMQIRNLQTENMRLDQGLTSKEETTKSVVQSKVGMNMVEHGRTVQGSHHHGGYVEGGRSVHQGGYRTGGQTTHQSTGLRTSEVYVEGSSPNRISTGGVRTGGSYTQGHQTSQVSHSHGQSHGGRVISQGVPLSTNYGRRY